MGWAHTLGVSYLMMALTFYWASDLIWNLRQTWIFLLTLAAVYLPARLLKAMAEKRQGQSMLRGYVLYAVIVTFAALAHQMIQAEEEDYPVSSGSAWGGSGGHK